jgi:hypothetical protein
MKVIKIVENASGLPCPVAGHYLESYDPDWPDHPLGQARFTRNIAYAKTYADAGEAFADLMRVRAQDPVRPDGKPNRPLTAFTVSIEDKA